ncbi:MAG: hypothetical protein HY240_02330 [Actinobacteria bacterium]|nr:hypothetical protein [Actinomycetota bacterium]
MKIRPTWVVAAGSAVVALVALGVPLVGLLYVGVLLLCPLLMMSMHGGGDGHGAGGSPGTRADVHGSGHGPASTNPDEPEARKEGGQR